jgi:hypothetical protein
MFCFTITTQNMVSSSIYCILIGRFWSIEYKAGTRKFYDHKLSYGYETFDRVFFVLVITSLAKHVIGKVTPAYLCCEQHCRFEPAYPTIDKINTRLFSELVCDILYNTQRYFIKGTMCVCCECPCLLHWIWIYNCLCNQCLSALMLWVRISIRARCTTLCDKGFLGSLMFYTQRKK